jgi:hypothetical protein
MTTSLSYTPTILTSVGDFPLNDLPNTIAISFGGAPVGGINMTDIGTLYRWVSTTGVSPASAAANDYTLAVFSMPAGSLDQIGRGLIIEAGGSFANTANVKRCKIFWGVSNAQAVVGQQVTTGTLIADTGSYSTAAAVGWSLGVNVFKTASLNTQLAIHTGAQTGAVVGALVVPASLTAVESGVINVVLTGQSPTATTDVVANFLFINGVN